MNPELPKEAFEAELRIARAIAAGNERVASAFFEENHAKLYRFVLAHFGDAQEAEEIVADTWATAIIGLEGFSGNSTLLTWLCGIARFKISSRLRSRRRNVQQTRIEEFEQTLDLLLQSGQGGVLGNDEGPNSSGILEQIAQREVQQVLAATLAMLGQEYQDALRLKYLEGCSVRELAAHLGKSEKAAESVLHRAKEAFREHWRYATGEKIPTRRHTRPDRGGA